MAQWYTESLYPELVQRLRIGKIVYHKKTDNHEIMVFEHAQLGRVLTLDGVLQTTEADEYVYHEMIAHVPLLAHGAAKRVLIVGGGDGGSLRRCLSHDVAKVTVVEIDRAVVDCCRRHLAAIGAGAFDDPRAELVIDDGNRFVAETGDAFDAIIIDSTDPNGPGEVLFSQEFCARCRRCLAPGGILVAQNGVPFVEGEVLRDAARRLGAVFARAGFYIAAIPTYYGGYMAFGWATDGADPRQTPVERIRERFEASDLETRFYTPEIHVGAFNLPPFIAELAEIGVT